MEYKNLSEESNSFANVLMDIMAEPMQAIYDNALNSISRINNITEGTAEAEELFKDLETMQPLEIISKYATEEELTAFVKSLAEYDRKPIFEKLSQMIYEKSNEVLGEPDNTFNKQTQLIGDILSVVLAVFFEKPIRELGKEEYLTDSILNNEFVFIPYTDTDNNSGKAKRDFELQLFGEASADNSTSLYDYLPSSSMLYLFNSVITHHAKERLLKTTKNGTRQSNRHKLIEYKKANNGYTITQTDKTTGDQLELTISNINKLQGKGIKKCFAFLLTESNKQNFNATVSFPLQELVERGMYANIKTARQGIKDSLDTLQTIKFAGTVKKGKKKTIAQAEAGVLFYHYKIKNNYVEVSINENFNIDFIASYYALIPRFIYALNNSNAFDIAEYIFLQARQNTADIKNGKPLNISFAKIRELLALPYAEEYTDTRKKWKPKQYVIEPILSAVEDIKAEAQSSGNTEFEITAVYDINYKTLEDFLEGYLSVTFSGELHTKLCEIATAQEDRITKAMEGKSKK